MKFYVKVLLRNAVALCAALCTAFAFYSVQVRADQVNLNLNGLYDSDYDDDEDEEGRTLDDLGDDVIVYNAANFSNLSGRTADDVKNMYYQALKSGDTYIDGNSSSYYTTAASTSAPYSAGVLSSDTLDAMKGMTDFYRWLIGVDTLTVNSESNESLQAQALDRNFEFDHNISQNSKPQDMDQDMWDAGYACNHNILAMGYTPQDAVTGWLDEGYRIDRSEWDTVGHRTSILSSMYSSITYGYSGNIAIGKCGSTGNTMTNAFAAYPAAGYMPDNLVSRNKCSWSVELNTSYVYAAVPSDVLVTITDLDTGTMYTRKTAVYSAEISSGFINFVQPYDPTDIYESYGGKSYQVLITGLTDAATGQEAAITYTVNFFSVVGNTINSYSISRDKYAYTGEAIVPEADILCGTDVLTEGTDYDLYYYNNVQAGTAVICAVGKGNYTGILKIPYYIIVNDNDVGYADITLNHKSYTYDGTAKEPVVTVSLFGENLTEGTDFEVSYSNNINAGTAAATITGIGAYHGTLDKKYSITKAFQSMKVKFDTKTMEPGSTHKVTVTAAGAPSYSCNNTSILTVDADGTIHALTQGTAYVTVRASATDNYWSESRIYTITVSYDYHTLEIEEYPAVGSNIARFKCSVCGIEKDLKTLSSLSMSSLMWTINDIGGNQIPTSLSEGTTVSVSLFSAVPSDAENTELAVASSDESIAVVNDMTFTFVGTGQVTITVSAKYNPQVSCSVTFTVSHVYSDAVVIREATCTQAGEKSCTCSVCGESYREEIPAAGHKSVTDQAVAATCTEPGLTRGSHCSVCGAVIRAQTVVPAAGHSYTSSSITEATCTEAGAETFTCTECGGTYTEEIPAKGHTYTSRVTTEPTCVKAGVKTCTCSSCGDTYTEEIPAVGHTPGVPVKENVIPASSKKDGSYDLATYCQVCSEELSRETRVITWEAVNVRSIEIAFADGELAAGKSTAVPAVTILPENADNKEVLWFSSDTDTAVVDEKGVVTAVKYSSVPVTITAAAADSLAEGEDTLEEILADSNAVYTSVQIQTRFSDVAGTGTKAEATEDKPYQYYFNAVYWAAEKGITRGYTSGDYAGRFGVELECTRQDFVLFLYRLAGSPETYSDGNTKIRAKDAEVFNDVNSSSLSSTFRKAIAWAVDKGITKGYSHDDGTKTFGVGESIIRKDAIIMLYRYAGKPAVSDTNTGFTDVDGVYKTSSDTFKAIAWAKSNKITSGLSQSQSEDAGLTDPAFGCNLFCMREQMITFIYRGFGSDK